MYTIVQFCKKSIFLGIFFKKRSSSNIRHVLDLLDDLFVRNLKIFKYHPSKSA